MRWTLNKLNKSASDYIAKLE